MLGRLLEELVVPEQCWDLVGICVGLHLLSCHLRGGLDAVVEVTQPEHHAEGGAVTAEELR